ncbi:MAG: hypothetical protein WA208_18605 [Thermoanaerobaculia bacterium]
MSGSHASRTRVLLVTVLLVVACVSFATGVDGTRYLAAMVRADVRIPTYPYLVMAPAKLLFGLVLFLIAALPARSTLERFGFLAMVSGVCLVLGIAALLIGGVTWLILERGMMPDIMTPATWLFALVVAPAQSLAVTGVIGLVKQVLFESSVPTLGAGLSRS